MKSKDSLPSELARVSLQDQIDQTKAKIESRIKERVRLAKVYFDMEEALYERLFETIAQKIEFYEKRITVYRANLTVCQVLTDRLTD